MKTIFIVAIIIFAVGIIVYFFFLRGGPIAQTPDINSAPGSSLPVSSGVSSTSNTALPADYIGTASEVLGSLPTGAYLQIGTSKGTVQVKNFYMSNPPVVESGDVFIKRGNGYWIIYDPARSDFWVAISGAPFDAVREKAEQDFLTTLEINQGDACKLDVSVGISYGAGNALNGKSLPLSFCAGR